MVISSKSELLEKQRDILFEVCRDVAINDKCPEWISKSLRSAVLKARNLKMDEFPSFDDKTSSDENEEVKTEKEIGCLVKSNIQKDNCIYEIIGEEEIIEGVQLYNVKIVRGDINNPEGTIIHNVPDTKLIRIK